MEKPFDNREILSMFREQNESREEQTKDLKAHFSALIQPLTAQVTITNGKVAELSKWREQVRGAGMAIKGIWGVIGITLVGMAYALFNMWVQFQSLDETIKEIVQQELNDSESNYEFDTIP